MRETLGGREGGGEARRDGGGNHSAQWHPSSIMLRPIPSSVHFNTAARGKPTPGMPPSEHVAFSPRTQIPYLTYFPAGSRMHERR